MGSGRKTEGTHGLDREGEDLSCSQDLLHAVGSHAREDGEEDVDETFIQRDDVPSGCGGGRNVEEMEAKVRYTVPSPSGSWQAAFSRMMMVMNDDDDEDG